MQASSFDFDVITGPSTPREERDESGSQVPSPPQPAETAPAPTRTR